MVLVAMDILTVALWIRLDMMYIDNEELEPKVRSDKILSIKRLINQPIGVVHNT